MEDNRSINLKEADRIYLTQQIKDDMKFFSQNEIIDYSLLVGYSTITPTGNIFQIIVFHTFFILLIITFLILIEREQDID